MDERRRALNTIRNDEQCAKYKEELERYRLEYAFLKTHPDAIERMKKMAKEKESVALENRVNALENGRYEAQLLNNITAYLLAINEYETNLTPIEMIKGLITRDQAVIENIKKKYLKSRAEREGLPQVEVINLDIQPREDAIMQVFEEIDLVNLEKPEMSLIPVEVNPSEVLEAVNKMLQESLVEMKIESGDKAMENITKNERGSMDDARASGTAIQTNSKQKQPEEREI